MKENQNKSAPKSTNKTSENFHLFDFELSEIDGELDLTEIEIKNKSFSSEELRQILDKLAEAGASFEYTKLNIGAPRKL